MKVQPIQSPLPGERVVGVDPIMRPQVETNRRRLNLYPGRTLSDLALTAEQSGRAGRLALRGQMATHGVVTGLEVGMEAPSGQERSEVLYLAPGLGLAASGEDVVVPQTHRVALSDLPVFAPSALLAESRENDSEESDSVESDSVADDGERDDTPAAGGAGALLARRMGPPLRELVERGVALPRAAILVLQPIAAEMIGTLDPTDPCEQDPESYAFDDWQLVDGCRPVLYAWPAEWMPLPVPGDRWRNRLAYTIFERETQLAPGEVMPWETLGVPIGLIGFEADFSPIFIDRHSVVRAGGRPRSRRNPTTGAGSSQLWRARIEQFTEHLDAVQRDGNSTPEATAQLRYLPPVGLLPRDAVDLETRQTRFFPGSFAIDAVPVPLEQLEIAFEASASLRPFDTFTADHVRILVPVPQAWYEPRLLQTEVVDPAFQEAIDRFTAERAVWLRRRQEVRRRSSALVRAITGEPLVFPEPDPDALEDEEIASDELDPMEGSHGTSPVLDDAGNPISDQDGQPTLRVDALEELRSQLQKSSPLREEEINELNARGLERFISYLDEKIRRANDRVDFGFLRVQADIYRVRQLLLGTTAATRLATSPALAAIVKGESAVATREDLLGFLAAARGKPIVHPDGGTTPSAGDTPTTPTAPAAGTGEPSGPVFHHASRSLSTELIRPDAGRLADIGGTTDPGSRLGGIADPGGRLGGTVDRGTIDSLDQRVGDRMPGEGLLFQARPTTREKIIGQSPIIGADYDFRTVTVTERLEVPPAPETKNFTAANKFEVVSELAELDIRLDDLLVPGVPIRVDGQPQYDERTGLPRRHEVALGNLGNLAELLDDPNPRDGDEATFFGVATDLLDHTTTLLRRVEGRIQSYRNALVACNETLNRLRTLLSGADRRLKEIGDSLAEARHDVAVARALLAEEMARIGAINERRAQILAEHVRFLAFQRPRLSHALLSDTPVRPLNPDVTELPPPACAVRPVEAPAELHAMVELLRRAPVRWFTGLPKLLGGLDRLELLHSTVVGARQRALLQEQGTSPGPAPTGLLGNAIARALAAQQTVVEKRRLEVAAFDLSRFASQSWSSSKRQAEQLVSLGDLIDGGQGRIIVNRGAARELEEILRTATCLYVRFGEVLPGIRLGWAERLSQHDTPIDLRDLNVLPRWGEIQLLDRREIQMLTDWLYGRVDSKQPDAVAMISDLVRVCLLLASHAPVNRIVAGQVSKPTTVRPGSRIELTVDLTRVHVGMQVLLYSGSQAVARAVVEDLSASHAAARVVHAFQEGIELAEGARAQFAEPSAVTAATSVPRSSSLSRQGSPEMPGFGRSHP
jgi:hypothetical protein